MSSMEGMGMDMGSDGMFRQVNQTLARTYWYLVAAIFGFAMFFKGIEAVESWSRSVFCPRWGDFISSPEATDKNSDLI